MFWNFWNFKRIVTKSEPTEPIITITHSLKITFRNNIWLKWTNDEFGDVGPITPWRDFYTWYFGRRDSQELAMKYKNDDGTAGETVIKRSDIVRFEVKREVKKEIPTSTGTDYPGPR